MKTRLMLSTAVCAFILSAAAAQQALQQKLEIVKQAVAQNQAALRQYTWTEQTNVLLKGEIKKTSYYQCRYGPDGTIQKTETGSSPAPNQQRGRVRQHVIEKKTGELKEYMQQAGALVKQYVPPDPQQMKAEFQSGNASLSQAGAGDIGLEFKNYVKPGDSLVLTFNTAAKALSQINVNTYMSDQKDAVSLQVNFQTLPGGPHYVAQTLLNAPAKSIQVQTTSSNYQRMGQ